MVTREQLDARRAALAQAPDLQALLATLERRNARFLEQEPLPENTTLVPTVKALLSQDGGVCPDDGTTLAFYPWNPDEHVCPRCGKAFRGERHHRNWARYQHLWLAERSAELATIAALRQDEGAAARARAILAIYGARYFSYPNVDNVLGPSRLFFSTYLESLWITSFLGAAVVLRAAELLDEPTERAVTQVADEAANLIGEFDERFSNRQTWNNTALTAIAFWFGDDELADRVVAGQTGLTAHLLYGFRPDGLWYEGENYHLFALRGLLTGITWARAAGADFTADERFGERLRAALLAPSLTALPDFTFPARKDSRFDVSLAQPMYLDTWEVGLAVASGAAGVAADDPLAAWLRALYRVPAPDAGMFESYLHEAGDDPDAPRPAGGGRARLSWWALLEMVPQLPASDEPWSAPSVLLEDQGLAILRRGDRYVSLEAGIWGGGHGHPDRLNLTLHAGGVHWLPDPGTGTYVSPDLAWYRSTLAHNAPRVDRESQHHGQAICEMFDEQENWAWVRGRFGDLVRTVVAGPGYIIDMVELSGQEGRVLELPWHFNAATELASGGPPHWVAGRIDDSFVTEVEQLERGRSEPIVLRATAGDARLTAHLVFDGALLRAQGPGLPGSGHRAMFYVARTQNAGARLVTVLDPGGVTVKDVRVADDDIEVRTADGTDAHRATGDGWTVATATQRVALRGPKDPPQDFERIIDLEPPERARGTAFRLDAPPPLDGSAAGFDPSEPLHLDIEDQYRRSEEPYPGPEDFSATALAGWDEDALYLCVEVVKRDLLFRPADAPPLKLDNILDDLHSDGLQIFVGHPERPELAAVLVIPAPGFLIRTRPDAWARGAWQETDAGYRVTLAVPWPDWLRPHSGEHIGFDLLVTEMLPGRVRRAGQLAWSGGNGWVYLRQGQEWDRLGELTLVG